MRYFDLHCDTILGCLRGDVPLAENEMHINLKKAEPIDAYVQCFAVFIPDKFRGEEAFQLFCRAADRLDLEIERNAERLSRCRKPGDLAAVEKEKKHGAVLTIESGAALGGDLSHVEELKRRGVQMCTLTWNGENELGQGLFAEAKIGLTDFGKQAVRAFENAGILVDISHASPQLFWDVAEIAEKPLVASHSNSKSICSFPRNLDDKQFEAVKNSGGLVGLNFCPDFLNNQGESASMEDVLRHAERFLSLGGENVIAMGSDFDGTELPRDMEDGLSAIPRLYELFLRHYPQDLVDRIFYGNAARFFRENGLL